MSPRELAEELSKSASSLVLLDVREPDERAIALIDPSIHIPMNEVPARHEQLPQDRAIVVYCHHGSRSAMVAAFLETVGFRDVVNLTGGIDAWSVEVDRRVRRYT
jgi:rhodanese-related sulfurtransferase